MIRIGVLGTASIAQRRMIPAILKNPAFRYVCVACSNRNEMVDRCSDEEYAERLAKKEEKGRTFVEAFGGEFMVGYKNLLQRSDIDAVYIPLPPALHAYWAKQALKCGKHVLLEKPFTTSNTDTAQIIALAKEQNLAVFENYGFCDHKQMAAIQNAIATGEIGQLRLIRTSFGFPHRESGDFRYCKALGGGALLDCGGYTLKAATALLGSGAKVTAASLVTTEGHEVDVFGHAMLCDKEGNCAQVSFGMDNYYKCELEVWGSTGYISAPRIFTAPDGFQAPVTIKNGTGIKELRFADDQFAKAAQRFCDCIYDTHARTVAYDEILLQSELVQSCGLSCK